ncbi:pyruvate formate-lyase-activating protein [Robertkochia aurantiaca]|uniref:pyruvate formate-lyase-activating protein n=1 Tax=Robertkochia aurantiaca TaxID=2873700 RepID=UPI001CCABB7A|nr:pyruvate formate-lyase-activating protein [Robertkochia sp. 3YJGBD-33]
MSTHLPPDTLAVHSIESFGTHDGPGIRFVIFLQGCKLKCRYCHNPDTITTSGGTLYPIEELVSKAVKMKPYFGKLGGVTISGGEPLLQAKALLPLLKRLKEEGIHTNIDTNGRVLNHFSRELHQFADLVMLDIKHLTEEGFRDITGARNKDVTLSYAAERESLGKPLWLRYVLIPGITNQPEYLHRLGTHFKDYKHLERIELQPYHRLGVHKWKALGWKYTLEDARENTEEEIQSAAEILRRYFKEVRVN